MARIRSLKPEFFEDEDLAEFPFWVRILYAGLWCNADKEGRLEDRPLKLKAKIFPYDKKIDVDHGLNLLAKPKIHSPQHLPFIVRYEVKGEKYIQILLWTKHQSPHHTEKESKIPAFNGEITVKEPLGDVALKDDRHHKSYQHNTKKDGELTVKEPLLKGATGDAHYQETMNNESDQESEQRSGGTTKPAISLFELNFEEFWKAYPRKVAKEVASESFKRLIIKKKEKPEEIKLAAERYSKKIIEDHLEKKFVLYPSTFLNKNRWKDYLPGSEAEKDPITDDPNFWKPRMA